MADGATLAHGEEGRGAVTVHSAAVGRLMEMPVPPSLGFLHVVASRTAIDGPGSYIPAYVSVDDRVGPRTVFFRRAGQEPEVPAIAPHWGSDE